MPLLLIILAVGVILLGSTKVYAAYVSGNQTNIEVEPIGNGYVMRKDAAQAFKAMASQANNDGVALTIYSAFRTMEEQTSLYSRYTSGTGNLAAKPGYSNHQSGIAVDIAVGNSFQSKTYLWLAANAPAYGFVNTGANFSQKEPWHWEYRP